MYKKIYLPERKDFETDAEFHAALVEYGPKTAKTDLRYISVGLDPEIYEDFKRVLRKENNKMCTVVRDYVKDYIEGESFRSKLR